MSIRSKVFNAITVSSNSKKPINFLTKVKCLLGSLKLETAYIGLSNTCFTLYSKDLNEIPKWSPIYYSDIEFIVVSSENPCQLMFQVTNRRKSYPTPSIPVFSVNSAILLENLSVLWSTDYMATTGQYSICPIIRRSYLHPSFDILPPPITESNEEYKIGNIKEIMSNNYKLIIPDDLEEAAFMDGCFKKKIKGKIVRDYICNIDLTFAYEISQMIPDNVLAEGRLADNIKYIAEKYGKQILQEHGLKECMKVEYSQEFPKILKTDLSKWEGWETLIQGGPLFSSVIVLRRSFIPPLMDSYQYIIFYTMVQFKPDSSNNPKKITSSESDIILELKPEMVEMAEITKKIAESIVPTEVCSKYYNKILNLRKRAMLLQVEETEHLEKIEKLKKKQAELENSPSKNSTITPEGDLSYNLGRLYAASAINALHKEMLIIMKNREKGDIGLENKIEDPLSALIRKSDVKQSVIVPVNLLSLMINTLKEMLDSLGYIIRLEHEAPESVVQLIENSGYFSSTSSKVHYYLNWKEKIANYLASVMKCTTAHNGLCALDLISEITQSYLDKYRRIIGENILYYLLHIREKDKMFDAKIGFGEMMRKFTVASYAIDYNPNILPILVKNGMIANICNRTNHFLYPSIVMRLMKSTENYVLLSAVLSHLSDEPFEKLLFACGSYRSQVEDNYMLLMEQCIKLMFSGSEELVVNSTNLLLKLMKLKEQNYPEMWTFELHSILSRNLHRTGSPRVACASLRLLAFLLSLESMPFVLSDPQLHLSESILILCKDIKSRPEHYTGEDIYRLLIIAYIIGTHGASKEANLIANTSKYAKLFAGLGKPIYTDIINMASNLLQSHLKRRMDARRQEGSEFSIWRKIWRSFAPAVPEPGQNGGN